MNVENKPKPPGPPRQTSPRGAILAAVVFASVFAPLWFLLQILYGFAAKGPPADGYLLIGLIAGVPAAVVWAVFRFAGAPRE